MFISLIWKEPYHDKFQCHKLKEGYFSGPGRFCVDPSQKILILCFHPEYVVFSSRCSLVSNIRPDNVAIPSRLPSVLRSFEQLKVASVQTSWQHVRLLFRIREDFCVLVYLFGQRGYTVPIELEDVSILNWLHSG